MRRFSRSIWIGALLIISCKPRGGALSDLAFVVSQERPWDASSLANDFLHAPSIENLVKDAHDGSTDKEKLQKLNGIFSSLSRNPDYDWVFQNIASS